MYVANAVGDVPFVFDEEPFVFGIMIGSGEVTELSPDVAAMGPMTFWTAAPESTMIPWSALRILSWRGAPACSRGLRMGSTFGIMGRNVSA